MSRVCLSRARVTTEDDADEDTVRLQLVHCVDPAMVIPVLSGTAGLGSITSFLVHRCVLPPVPIVLVWTKQVCEREQDDDP